MQGLLCLFRYTVMFLEVRGIWKATILTLVDSQSKREWESLYQVRVLMWRKRSFLFLVMSINNESNQQQQMFGIQEFVVKQIYSPKLYQTFILFYNISFLHSFKFIPSHPHILFLILFMHAKNSFQAQSPDRLYQYSQNYTTKFSKTNDLPLSPVKVSGLEQLTQQKKASIKYAIDYSRFQNSLYRRLQKADESKRKKFGQSILEKQKKVDENIVEIEKKHGKSVEKVNKHLEKVYKKHVQIEKSKKQSKNEEAYKLRKELLQFYSKEKQRKKEADADQIKVPTCYQGAVNRINKLHQINDQYAKKSEEEYKKRMARNSNRDRYVQEKARSQSAENAKKSDVYDMNDQLLTERENHFVQIYCNDLDTSLKAFDFKEIQDEKVKERINKFFKKRVEKWKSNKRRVDEESKIVPEKCLNILEKTKNATFAKTVSSFKESGKDWYNKVQLNKSAIYERDENKKDMLMRVHLDMTLRNSATEKINREMGTMRNQGRKLANEYN